MPGAIEYQPDDPKLREQADAERGARAARLARNWKYYNGDHPRPLKVARGVDNNVIINLVAQHVDHTVSFAAPDFPRLELDPDGETDDERALKAFWEATGGAGWLTNTILGGVLAGHVAVRLLAPSQPGGRARAVVLNPANVLTFWADDDYESALWYEVRYRVGRRLHRVDLIAPDVITARDIDQGDGGFLRLDPGKWTIRELVCTSESDTPGRSQWQAIAVDQWPYDCAPIIDWAHLPKPGSYYGADELQHIGLNDAINKTASDIKAILRVHASPKRVAVGIKPSDIQDTRIDEFWAIDGKTPDQVRISNLEMQSDLESSMRFIEFLSGAYFRQARVTFLDGGPDAYKGVTNLGIRAAFMPQLGKTETIHRTYGEGIARISQAAMMIEGRQIERPAVYWKTALPESEAEKTQTQAAQIAMGVQSQAGAAARLGIDFARVLAQRLQEHELSMALDNGAPIGVSG